VGRDRRNNRKSISGELVLNGGDYETMDKRRWGGGREGRENREGIKGSVSSEKKYGEFVEETRMISRRAKSHCATKEGNL